jgi:hypothetical protein
MADAEDLNFVGFHLIANDEGQTAKSSRNPSRSGRPRFGKQSSASADATSLTARA